VDAVNPDVVIEDLAVLHPKLVVEARRLLPRPSMRGVVAPRFERLTRFEADDPDLVAVRCDVRLV
jgi:hypothetical protein